MVSFILKEYWGTCPSRSWDAHARMSPRIERSLVQERERGALHHHDSLSMFACSFNAVCMRSHIISKFSIRKEEG